jgi:Spy/CpxP family protein refolding chaperone
MKKAKSIIIGLVIVFVMVGTAFAKSEGEHQQRGDRQKENIFKELNLTPEQQKKLDENRKAQRQDTEKLFSALKEKQVKLQDALKDHTVTRDKVEPLVKEMKSLQAQMVDHRIDGIFAVRDILTPEQFAKFQQMMEKRAKDRKGHFKNSSEKRKGVCQNQKQQKPVE